MTMSAPEMDRLVRRHDNEIQSIYELLSMIESTQRRHTMRFDEMERQFGDLSQDVATLKTDIADLKTDVGTLKTDVAEVKSDVRTVIDLLRGS